MNLRTIHIIAEFLLVLTALSCGRRSDHTAPAVREQDSVPMMVSYGVNSLISDSGVIKYRIVAERWEVNNAKDPTRWIFEKGIFFEQFDEKFNIQAYIQSDTAYYYDRKRIWELCGRVNVLTEDGLKFNSEQLFWDENKHEFYSYKFSRLVTPDRTLEGNYFRSDEQMNKYNVYDSAGSFEKGGITGANDTLATAPDTVKVRLRPGASPRRKNNK